MADQTDEVKEFREQHVLQGERLEFKEQDTESKKSDEELNQRYVRGETRIVTETARYSLANILTMLQEKVLSDDNSEELRYKLDPEYQQAHRWNIERKSRLIESFLMNIPVPPLFLYERDLARFEVMDGKQRLTAISEFYDNKFPLRGLQYWSELNGRTYEKLPSKIRDGIDRRYISSIILLKETASNEEQATRLKKLVFERLNSGGVDLKPQETRNAMYDGPLNRLCFELSKNELFCRMWSIPQELPADEDLDEDNGEKDELERKGKELFESMGDLELVLRFFAYRQIHKWKSGLNKINSLLDTFLERGNQIFDREILDKYRELFESTVSFLHEVLGDDAFCRLDQDGKRTRTPLRIIYDPLMYIASQYSTGEHRNILLENKATLRDEIIRMYTTDPDIFQGRRTDYSTTLKRDNRVLQAFKSAISSNPS